jgi:hypothetical protein
LLEKCVLLPKNIKMQIIVVKKCEIFAIKTASFALAFELKLEKFVVKTSKKWQKVAITKIVY